MGDAVGCAVDDQLAFRPPPRLLAALARTVVGGDQRPVGLHDQLPRHGDLRQVEVRLVLRHVEAHQLDLRRHAQDVQLLQHPRATSRSGSRAAGRSPCRSAGRRCEVDVVHAGRVPAAKTPTQTRRGSPRRRAPRRRRPRRRRASSSRSVARVDRHRRARHGDQVPSVGAYTSAPADTLMTPARPPETVQKGSPLDGEVAAREASGEAHRDDHRDRAERRRAQVDGRPAREGVDAITRHAA